MAADLPRPYASTLPPPVLVLWALKSELGGQTGCTYSAQAVCLPEAKRGACPILEHASAHGTGRRGY